MNGRTNSEYHPEITYFPQLGYETSVGDHVLRAEFTSSHVADFVAKKYSMEYGEKASQGEFEDEPMPLGYEQEYQPYLPSLEEHQQPERQYPNRPETRSGYYHSSVAPPARRTVQSRPYYSAVQQLPSVPSLRRMFDHDDENCSMESPAGLHPLDPMGYRIHDRMMSFPIYPQQQTNSLPVGARGKCSVTPSTISQKWGAAPFPPAYSIQQSRSLEFQYPHSYHTREFPHRGMNHCSIPFLYPPQQPSCYGNDRFRSDEAYFPLHSSNPDPSAFVSPVSSSLQPSSAPLPSLQAQIPSTAVSNHWDELDAIQETNEAGEIPESPLSSEGELQLKKESRRDRKMKRKKMAFKTKLCRNYIKGFCRFGEKCQFAHGSEELNTVYK